MGATTQKALCVSTRCTSVDQFVTTFFRFCEDDTFFIATLSQRPVGLDTAFSIQLADKTPVLRGDCTVIEAWSTPINRFGRPGVRLALKRLTAESRLVLQRLQDAAAAAPNTSTIPTAEIPPPPVTPPPTPMSRPSTPTLPRLVKSESGPVEKRAPTLPPVRPSVTTTQPLPSISIPERAATTNPPPPLPRAKSVASPVPSIARGTTRSAPITDEAAVVPLVSKPAPEPAKVALARVEERVAGSSFVLPANPLMNLTDSSIEGFVDCALYEEPANFLRSDGTADVLEEIDNVVPGPRTLVPFPAVLPPEGYALVPTTIPPPMGHPSTIPPPMGRPTTIPPPFMGGYQDLNPVPMTGMSGVYPMPQPGMSGPFYMPQPGMSGQFLMPQPPQQMQQMQQPPNESHMRTAAMRAVSPPERRWYIIGGAAAGTMILLIAIGVANSGGGSNPVKVAAADPGRAVTPKPLVRTSAPVVDAPKDAKPPVAVAVAAVQTPVEPPGPAVPDPVDEPAETAETAETAPISDAPPEVGSGACMLVVSTTPAGSIVRIDDRVMGPSPLSIHATCGKHRLDVRHPRYAPVTRWATATEGSPATVEIPLARPTHTVAFTTIPSGATISIGGRRAGTSPTTIKVMGFQGMNVTFEKKGFKKVTQKVYSKKDNERLTVRLTR